MFPGNELCDGMDNDCDESLMVGEESDADSDGFLACEDCNDGDPGIHPQQWDNPADAIDADCRVDRNGAGNLISSPVSR